MVLRIRNHCLCQGWSPSPGLLGSISKLGDVVLRGVKDVLKKVSDWWNVITCPIATYARDSGSLFVKPWGLTLYDLKPGDYCLSHRYVGQ